MLEEKLWEERWNVVRERMFETFKEFLTPLQVEFKFHEDVIELFLNSSHDIKKGRFIFLDSLRSGEIEFTNDDIQRYIIDNVSYINDYMELEKQNVNEFIEELVMVSFNDMIDDYMNYENIRLNGDYDWILKELSSRMFNKYNR